jgi:hypothetical protein
MSNFCKASAKVNRLKFLCRSIWCSFKLDFKDILEAIGRHSNALYKEIALAHRLKLHKSLNI